MNYVNNNQSTVSIFDDAGIAEKFVESMAPMLSPAYQRPKLSILIDQLENGTQKRKAGQRVVNIYRQDNDFPSAVVQESSQRGSNIYVTLTQNTFASIPVNHMVNCTTGAVGKVLDKGQGWMLIGFVTNPNGSTAFNFSTDFIAGEPVIDGGQIGNNMSRQEDETIFSLPDNIQNIIPTYNTDVYLTHDDVHTRTYLTAANGTQYYATNKDMQALQRLMQQYTVRTYKNIPAVFNDTEPVAASLVNQIVSMGGTYRPINSQLTYSELKNTVRGYTSKGGFTTNEIAIFCGSQYIADFQEATENFVTTAGKNNVLGGQEVKGIDIYKYSFQGLDLKFIVDPLLDNQRMFGTGSDGFSLRSRSAIWMNTAPVPAEGGGTVPFAAAYYFANTADIQRWITPGNMDDKGNTVTEGQPFKGCKIHYTWDKMEQISNPRAALYHGPSAA